MRTGRWHRLTAMLLAVFATDAAAKFTPGLAPEAQRVDAIRVYKAARKMDLLRDGKVIRSYRVHLGGAPLGPKRQQGDQRTPEGEYAISYRNAASRFHLSLQVSYPNADDLHQALAQGIDPGGDIMIHGGTPPGASRDWTEGCIAVTNAEIEEIWRLVPVGTPVRIDP